MLADRNRPQKAKRHRRVIRGPWERLTPPNPHARWLWCELLLVDPTESVGRFIDKIGRAVGLLTPFDQAAFARWALRLQRCYRAFLHLKAKRA